MTIRSAALLACSALAAASCAAAPVKITEGEQCFRCRRTIVDARMAAEIVQPRFVSKFRTSGCLAKYLANHADETGAIFVTDFPSGKLVPAKQAMFVSVIVDPNTNERDYRAYQSLSEAEVAAVQAKTMPVGWHDVVAKGKS